MAFGHFLLGFHNFNSQGYWHVCEVALSGVIGNVVVVKSFVYLTEKLTK